MEQDVHEVGVVSRSQNVVYVIPHDGASVTQFLSPAIDRVDEKTRDVQLLVITSDLEVAAITAAAAVKLTKGRDVSIVAATSARRAATLLRARPAQVVTGTPETIVEMLKGASIKLETVRTACLVWADELVTRGSAAALETLMAELPKDGARIVVTSELTGPVDELLERYARRARRVLSAAHESDQPVSVEYVTVSGNSRLSSLRRVIDEADPRTAMVFAREAESTIAAGDLLRALGYDGDSAPVKIGLVAPPGTDLVVLLDLPASRSEMWEAASGAKRAVALIQPRQLASLRALAAGGAVKSFTLPESALRARDRDERARAELRAVLEDRHFGRELLALEPLLDEFDGIEIAAAAVQLLDQERAERAALVLSGPSVPRDRAGGSMTRLFISVGSRDNVRPADLVGAIANQAGVPGASVGKVDVRESHSLVEVSADISEVVIEKVTGSEIRGRRAIVRRDEERHTRDAGRGAHGSTRGSRDDKHASPRGRDRSERAPSNRAPRPTARSPRTGDRE